MADISIPFDAALQDYEKKTSINLASHPFAAQLDNSHSVESITTVLLGQVQAFSGLRAGDSRIIKSIKNIVSIITGLSATPTLGYAVGFSFQPAIYVALAILLKAAKHSSASYDPLVDLVELIEGFLRRLDIYTEINPTRVMSEMVTKIMVELLYTFALATNDLKQGRLRLLGMKILGDTKVKVVLQRLDRLTQDEDEARTMADQTLEVVYNLVKSIGVFINDGEASLDRDRETLEILHQRAGEKSKSKRDRLQLDLREWLSPPDPWINYQFARASHHKGTGAWFVQGDTFLKWKTSGGPPLWVHGKPGTGKSVLCSTIIEEIETMQKLGLASLAFYYHWHDFRDCNKSNARGLLSSLLLQLCDQSEAYYDILSTFYSTHHLGAQYPGNDELFQCLMDLLELPGQAPVYLVIDALDQCPNTSESAMPSPRKEVLTLVEHLVSRLASLRLCVTSRPEIDIMRVLEPLAFRLVSIHEGGGQMEDIKNYIESVVNTDPMIRMWKQEDKEYVIDTLTKRADGMFRWVYFQLDYLRGCPPERIRHALTELPETLDEIYKHSLRNINEKSSEAVLRLFQWVAVASRPLRVEELADFLLLDFSARPIPKVCEDWRDKNPVDAVLSTCFALLSLVDSDVKGSQVIQFSHFSAKEFLMSARLAGECDTVSRYHVSMTSAHTLVAQACLGILLHLDNDDTIGSLQKFPLAKYAAKHWFVHARFKDVSECVEEGTKKLFDKRKPHLSVWLSIYDPIRGCGMVVGTFGTPIRYAAVCGLLGVVKALANEATGGPGDVPLGIDDGDKSTALHLASGEGHVDVAHALLKLGAKVTARDTDGSTPLHWASRKGHVDVARALVESGAYVSAQDKNKRTPLHLASNDGRVDLAKLLIDLGADVTAQDKLGTTPLHETLLKGHVDLARILVHRHADPKAEDKFGWTPLHVASSQGHVAFAEFLINIGADARTRDKNGSTPLHQLSRSHKGNVDLAKLLIKRGGADVKARDNDGSTPLHWALVNRREDLAEFLITNDIVKDRDNEGARLKVQDKDGSTPLHEALANGYPGLAKSILHNLNDTNFKAATVEDKLGRTPLDRASANCHVDADLKKLLDLHANTTAQDARQIQQPTCTCTCTCIIS